MLFLVLAGAALQPLRAEFRGVWIYDPRELDPDRTMSRLRAEGYDNVFVRLSSGGAAYYPSRVMPQVSGSADEARAWSEAAHRRGIRIHGWHVCFMMHHATQSSMNAVIKRGEAMMDSKGRVIRPSYKAVVRSPSADSTLEFEKAAMVELATRCNLDGVQFDYIRYPIYSADYSPAARKRFTADSGRAVKSWPWEVSKGSRKSEYHRWKMNVVTGLVRDVSRAVRSANPEVRISAAVWNDPDIGRAEFGQDWPGWVKSGYLDFVCPMSYTTSDALLRKWTRKQKKEVGGKVPIYSGLGVYLLKTPGQLARQIRIVRDEDMPGFVLYNYTDRVGKSFLSMAED